MQTSLRGIANKAAKTTASAEASGLEEPGAGIPHAGICEEAVGQPAVLPRFRTQSDPAVCFSGHGVIEARPDFVPKPSNASSLLYRVLKDLLGLRNGILRADFIPCADNLAGLIDEKRRTDDPHKRFSVHLLLTPGAVAFRHPMIGI